MKIEVLSIVIQHPENKEKKYSYRNLALVWTKPTGDETLPATLMSNREIGFANYIFTLPELRQLINYCQDIIRQEPTEKEQENG